MLENLQKEIKAFNPIIIIPARMGSIRLPGKPMLDIAGKPMIMRVWEKAVNSDIGPVLVATDDRKILNCIDSNGGKAILTNRSHNSGSDRVFEAIEIFDKQRKFDLIINLQGDMPLINPEIIKVLAQSVKTEEITSLVSLAKPEDIKESSSVKVAVSWDEEKKNSNISGKALFFSRSPIPYNAKNYWNHIGIYAWKRDALSKFVKSPQSQLEVLEKLEQLRALEMGMSIRVIKTDFSTIGVDTSKDLKKVRAMISE